jgi:hypothetical protein
MTATDEPTPDHEDDKDDEDPEEGDVDVRFPTGPRDMPQAE